MKTDEFIQKVAANSQHLNEVEHAREATRATLTTLSQMLTQGEATDLSAQLPDDLHDWVVSTKDKPDTGARVNTDTFIRSVGERFPGFLDADHATDHARVVLTCLRDAISDGEWDDIVSQLPGDFTERLVA